ncbi:hypothetical protein [Salaquimonas pukyongi]|uniref:hypothetical protein n=1 Tax=Salaquimonas pukyongi TaxID=2712698 RepID=UPI00096B8CA7|nr:hypothetical protein [Salaquimonas pukyongi]
MAGDLKLFMTPPGDEDHPGGQDEHRQLKRRMSEAEKERLARQHWDWLGFIALCALGGIALGAVSAWAVLRFDINGIGSMIGRSGNWAEYTALLVGGLASTLGMIAMGIGIMVRSTWPEH